MHTRDRLLIVDGYNVLRSGSRYVHLRRDPDYTDDPYNKARETLVDDVIRFAGREMKAIIVFDGGGNAFSTGQAETIGGVRVMFSPAGQSADRVIEKLAYDACARNVETMVVSSDAAIQDAVFGNGCDRMSAEGFSREAAQVDEEVRVDDTPHIEPKNTVAGRIDAETLEKLKRLRDGR